MAVTINGTTGVSTPGVANSGNETITGTLAVTGAATAGSLQVGGVATNVYPLVPGTAVSASGTAVDFTSIPSWVKRVTVMFSGVSTSGTSLPLIQLGAGSVVSSGYTAISSALYANATNNAQTSTAGFVIYSNSAAYALYGQVIFSNAGGNNWTGSGHFATTTGATVIMMLGGGVNIGNTLDRVRITTVNGTDTFDAGSINILYE